MQSKNKNNKTIGKKPAQNIKLADVLKNKFPSEPAPADFDIDEQLIKDWLEKNNTVKFSLASPQDKSGKPVRSRQYFKQAFINHKNNLSAKLEPRAVAKASETSLNSETINSPALVFAILGFIAFVFSFGISLLTPNFSSKIIKTSDAIFNFPIEKPYQIARNFIIYGYTSNKASEPVIIARPVAKETLVNFIKRNQEFLDELARNKINIRLVKEEDMPGLVAGVEEKAGEQLPSGGASLTSSMKTAGELFVKDLGRAANNALSKLFTKQKDLSLTLGEKIFGIIK